MPAVLYKVPLVCWVQSTIEKMNSAGKDDSGSWRDFWLATYWELGGASKNSGSKLCPRYAAYALWQLGRIADGGRPAQNWTVEEVKRRLGKNAAYAVLALSLLEAGWQPESASALWPEVQKLYRRRFIKPPAASEQGAVRVAAALFAEKQIVPL